MRLRRRFGRLVCVAVTAGCVCLAPVARANHGPGTAGGGTTTQSGETLKPGKFSVDIRQDYTEFENVTPAEIQRRTIRGGGFDGLDRSFLETVSLSYGVVEDFQVGVSMGYYHAVNSFGGEMGDDGAEVQRFNPDGFTDLWLSGKYRFYHGPAGNFAVFAGVKFPTGRDDVRTDTHEPAELSTTAGSGSYGGMGGLAWSRYLTERITMDVSAQYVARGEHHGFHVGDRIDGGVALAYRLTPDIKQYPQWSVFFETTAVHLFKNTEHGDLDPNSGGTTLFLSPGVRFGFSPNVAFVVSPQVPVWQDLRGEQLKTQLKVVAAVTLTF